MDLLACYNSGSDSDNDDSDFFSKSNKNEEDEEKEEEPTKETNQIVEETPATSSFFFSGDAGSSDSDEDEEEESNTTKVVRKRKPGEAITELNGDFESAIFDNDFAREERINMRMLSKHVKLSDKPETATRKKSKYTCKAYLKGKCRFGDNCRFSHPVHDRNAENEEGVTVSSEAKFYTETQEAQIFHSKKFKSSAGQ